MYQQYPSPFHPYPMYPNMAPMPLYEDVIVEGTKENGKVKERPVSRTVYGHPPPQQAPQQQMMSHQQQMMTQLQPQVFYPPLVTKPIYQIDVNQDMFLDLTPEQSHTMSWLGCYFDNKLVHNWKLYSYKMKYEGGVNSVLVLDAKRKGDNPVVTNIKLKDVADTLKYNNPCTVDRCNYCKKSKYLKATQPELEQIMKRYLRIFMETFQQGKYKVLLPHLQIVIKTSHVKKKHYISVDLKYVTPENEEVEEDDEILVEEPQPEPNPIE